MEAATDLVRVRIFGPLEVSLQQPDGSWRVVERRAWGPGTPPRSVLKRLLTAPARRLSRSDIEDDLWPDSNMELAAHHLDNGLTVIRKILGKDLLRTITPLYEIADQSHVWLDLDACIDLIKEAENQGCTAPTALPLLEEALSYFERGKCLEDEGERWCHPVRADAERMTRQCRMWLAEGYEHQGKLWQAGEQYRAMMRISPPDEEALQGWIQMLARHGKYQDALKCYQSTKDLLENQGYTLSQTITDLALHLKNQRVLALPSPTQPLPAMVLPKSSDERQHMDVSRRELLQGFLGIAGTTVFSGGAAHISADMLPLFASLTDTCRQLSEGNELTTAEHILWAYLPKIELLARLSANGQKSAANIASQGYLLAASLVGHRNDLLGRLHYSEQALRYGELADDLNLQAVAIRQIAISFDCMRRSDKVLEAYQQVLPYLDSSSISPLLRACIYADISGAHASLIHEREASHFLSLAYESFPAKLEDEPSYLATICRYSSLIFWEGVNHLSLHHPKDADQAFCRMLQSEIQSPERNRVEALNYRVEAFIELRDLERACACLEGAVKGAIVVGSTRRYRQGYDQLQRMQRLWRHEKQVQRLTDLFMS